MRRRFDKSATSFNFSSMFSKSRKQSLTQVKANPEEVSSPLLTKDKFIPKYPYQKAWTPHRRAKSSYEKRSSQVKNYSMVDEKPKTHERRFSQELDLSTDSSVVLRKTPKIGSKEKNSCYLQPVFYVNLFEDVKKESSPKKMKVVIKRKFSETGKLERWFNDELKGKSAGNSFFVRGSKLI